MERIGRDDMFMSIATIVSRRSECTRKKVGAVLTMDNRIICIGYNGVLPDMDPATGLDEKGESHTVHAEANIISFCARRGIATEGATLYLTLSPCEKCAELIIQAGIRRVLYISRYRDSVGIDLLNNPKFNISCHQYIE